jgi:hypothetical protein
MSEIDAEDSGPILNVDPEIKELLGLFDSPAFARRGLDMEYALSRIDGRCSHQRYEMLEMVRLRLKQWARVAARREDWAVAFAGPIDDLWELSCAEPPVWAAQPASLRQQQAVARDLISSVLRFNHRWRQFLDGLNLEPANQVIDQYNAYYVLEKECVMGSARLAARYFAPVPRLSVGALLEAHPLLPVPELAAGTRCRIT